MTAARQILDFVYLDLPRLESIGSQLIEGGVPEARTTSNSRQSAVEGEVSGSLPFVLKGSAGTRAVFSAGSTVTSRYHHRLVVEVLDRLRDGGFLYDPEYRPPDGAFIHMTGELQVVDPQMLGRFMEAAPDLQTAIAAFSQETETESRTRADRRAGRGSSARHDWPPRRQTDSMKKLMDVFAGGSARIRVLRGEVTVAVGVVEREKFVEDLERLIGRHGQRFGGTWSVLGQVNAASDEELKKSEGTNLFDMIESGGAELVEAVTQISGAGGVGLHVTPLAVYRTIVPR